MVKMGRISPVVGRIAKWVNLKPIVSIDANGKGVTMGSAFSKAQTESKILKQLDTLLNTNDLVTYVSFTAMTQPGPHVSHNCSRNDWVKPLPSWKKCPRSSP
jgi:uncharacterized protein